ncbi:MAG: ParA family protein [Alphaproteobacteria bacterium]|nr:ParA family protein [Alphaproteobacteria bacterium]
MAAVVSLASAKGGCSKTTLAVGVGAELALDGYAVVLLDADLNQHASKFGEKATIPNFSVIGEVDESNILQRMKTAYQTADMILVDLPGGSSMVAVKALTKSHFVLIPAQHSIMDARDAMKTVAQVDDAQELGRYDIPRSLIWTRVMPGFESAAAKRVRIDMENIDVPKFSSRLMHRAAFQEMFLRGEVPRQFKPGGSEAENLAAITAELVGNIERIAERQAPGTEAAA